MESDGHRRTPLKAWNPRWKDKLKEVCLQRVRQDRSQLLWKIRNGSHSSTAPSVQHNQLIVESTFGHIVADELKRVRQSSANADERHHGDGGNAAPDWQDTDMLWEHEPLATQVPTELRDGEYQELMLAMGRALYDDLQAEMRLQEAAMLEDYEAAHALEDQSIVELLQSWQERGDGVLCPLCKTRQLQQIQTIIFCACGQFRLDTQDDQMGLAYLRTRLADVHQDHTDSGCLGQPAFSIESRFGIPALYMQCPTCRSFQWVL